MENTFANERRVRAWANVKLAVRDYARNPSDGNARKVEDCWDVIRRCEGQGAAGKRTLLQGTASRFSRNAQATARVRRRLPRRVEDEWPVNEIVLRSLLEQGLSDAKIAQMYHVPSGTVSGHRKALGL